MSSGYRVQECQNPACRLRFPAPGKTGLEQCPRCGGRLYTAVEPFASQRVEPEGWRPEGGLSLMVVLDNLRSAFNVGSILRTAEGAGASEAVLCGITPTPDNPKVAKTALSAEFAIPWRYEANGVAAVERMRAEGTAVWALEGGPGATRLDEALQELPARLALVAGNEVAGVDPGILSQCERVVYLPMAGFKRSLNVAVACGIALYLLRLGTLQDR